MGFHVCMARVLLLLCVAFDDDSALTRSFLLNLFTRYLCDDKNNALRIFMLSGSIQFSTVLSSFHFNTNHVTFLKQCF